MRKKSAGLFSLVVAAGLGTTLGMPALSASAAPQVSQVAAAGATSQPDQVQSDDLPNPADEKEAAAARAGHHGPAPRQGDHAAPRRQHRREGRHHQTVKSADRTGDSAQAASTEDQYVELSREKTDKIFVILAEFGNERHPSYPDQDTDPPPPARRCSTARCTTQIPAPGPVGRQLDRLAAGLQPGSYFQDLYFGDRPERRESVKTYYEKQSSGRYSVDGRSPTGSRSTTTRPATAAATATRAPATSAATPGT